MLINPPILLNTPFPSEAGTSLEVGGAGLGELEGDAAAGELAVDLGVGVEAVVDAATLLLVEDDLEELGAVLLGAEALADDLDGVDEVGEDGVVDGSEGPRAGALLLEGVAGAGGALGAREDAARGEEDDVAVRELLLELAGQAAGVVSIQFVMDGRQLTWDLDIPLLDPVEALEGRNGDKDDDRLPAVANLDLSRSKVSMRAPGLALDRFPSDSTLNHCMVFFLSQNTSCRATSD